MNAGLGSPVHAPPPGEPRQRRIFRRPSTRLGWYSFALMLIFMVLFLINVTIFMPATLEVPWRRVVLPFYGITMLACGLAAGITGLIAVTRRHERSWLVWLALLPGLFVLIFVLGEFLMPH
jgi:hypothetical protein